jgi:hypothetical protein
MQMPPEIQEAGSFDYRAPAELFSTRSRKRTHLMRYRRFAEAAAAIRFAIESLPPDLLIGAFLEVGEKRYGYAEIRRLYGHSEYPLLRNSEIRHP